MQTFTVRSSYNQIALLDAEDNTAYPEFPATGDPDLIFGKKGIVVIVCNDYDVLVHIGAMNEVQETLQDTILKGKGVITIGNRGLQVGNIASADVHQVPCASGAISVEVWGDPTAYSTSITFVLSDTH